MYQDTVRQEFPEFFSERGALQKRLTPLEFGQEIYWMSSLACKHNDQPNYIPLQPYDDNDKDLVNCEEVDDDYEIGLTKFGKFTTSFYVPSCLLPYIIGSKASKLKSLEKNTNTQIKVPKQNEKGNVTIIGDTERKVASARTQICMIVMQRKEKMPITHFISIPMVSDSIKIKLDEFKHDILKNPARGITESIFQNPEKLHLTITTLKLLDEEEIANAKLVLNTCYEEVILKIFKKNINYKIHLKGIEIMNDDPFSVNVLYGNVEMGDETQNNELQRVSNAILEYFYKAGLAKKQYDSVKLHVTLMNTSFRRPEEKQESFDADDILKKYKHFYFGVVDLKTIHLSIRFTGRDQYYEPLSTVTVGE